MRLIARDQVFKTFATDRADRAKPSFSRSPRMREAASGITAKHGIADSRH
jgi:hypothetical protein